MNMVIKDLEDRVFIINKPAGPTSFGVVEALRKATGIKRIGHTGTLDPLASGVLLLCTGKATRAVEQFMNLEKTYEFTVRLGIETTTLDTEGEVVRQAPVPPIDDTAILRAAGSFVGRYDMDPPVYSALKQNGKRLYELARQGQQPIIERRSVVIHALDVIGIELPDVHFRVRCSRGTYVRSLARDFGAVFDLPAHLVRLVRTAIGRFAIDDAYPCERIDDGDIRDLRGLPLCDALDFLPGVIVTDRSKRGLFDGVLPRAEDVIDTVGAAAQCDVLRILDQKGELLAIGNRSGDRNAGRVIDSFRLVVDRRGVTN
jgi:tRNA pseudouridine55 synthase